MQGPSEIKVSYCTTCHGRLWQVALTLFDNLRRLREDEELVLVDYGSRDGLGRFVASSPICLKAIEAGRLVYARTEAKHYHCPKAKNLAHRLGRGELLVNLDADNNNHGMRRVISRYLSNEEDVILQMDEGKRGDPLRGTFGRICIPRYWFYRLGGYDESFAPIGHQDQDLIWRGKALGLQHVCSRTGGPGPIRNTMVEKASHTGGRSWHAMWRANEKASLRNLKEGLLVANPQGWCEASAAINFNDPQTLAAVSPQLISMVLLHRQPSLSIITSLLDRYAAMPLIGEILVINQNRTFTISPAETRSKAKMINTVEDSQPFARLAAAALASFPAVLFTSDDVFLPEESLTEMHKAWFADPMSLHAVGGPREIDTGSGEANLSVGLLTTVPVCLTALAFGSRLCAEIMPVPPARAEDILLSFTAARSSPSSPIYHAAPVFEMGETRTHANGRLPRKQAGATAHVIRWCRRNIARTDEPELIIEAGPSPPAPITYEPFFAPSTKDSVLFAGPWVGEFGWELCWWNPMVRSMAENFEHVIVAAPESSRYLYEFATEFIPLKTEGWRFAEGKLLTKVPRVCNGSKTLGPTALWEELGLQECDALRTGEATLTPKKWRVMAPSVPFPPVADVLCAFRPEKRIEDRVVPGKDYSIEKCAEVVELLLREGLQVACYGGRDNYFFEGTIDLRGLPLDVQCAALSAAKCAVGPSSAPLHLASLSQCPHVTWSRISEDVAIRYEMHWNPFQTPACFITAPDPSPREVVEEVMRTIEETAYGLRQETLAV
jgi:hypothetical protein